MKEQQEEEESECVHDGRVCFSRTLQTAESSGYASGDAREKNPNNRRSKNIAGKPRRPFNCAPRHKAHWSPGRVFPLFFLSTACPHLLPPPPPHPLSLRLPQFSSKSSCGIHSAPVIYLGENRYEINTKFINGRQLLQISRASLAEIRRFRLGIQKGYAMRMRNNSVCVCVCAEI